MIYYYPNGGAAANVFNVTKFSDPHFDASFAGAFTGFAKFGDPNVHPVPEVITPKWEVFKRNHTEMLFNQTENSQPDIRAIETDPALLERCA